MSVALISLGVLVYFIGCFLFSKRSKHVMTMMVAWPLDVLCAGVDVAYDMPAHLFAAGRWCGVRVRRHGVEFFAFIVLLTCLAVWGCAVWCGRVCKGACVGAIGAIRGRHVITMDNDTYQAIVGGDDDDDDDNSGAHDDAGALDNPLEDADREKMYPHSLITS